MILPFIGGGESPVLYLLDHEGHHYYIRYRHGFLSVDVDDNEVCGGVIGGQWDGVWTDEETNVYLSEISRAILDSRLAELHLPTLWEARSHPCFRKGPLPKHPVGLTCGRDADPNAPPMVVGNRHERKRRERAGIHDHDVSCLAHVAANQVAEWIAAHPVEHAKFRKTYRRMWKSCLELQSSVVDETNDRQWAKG